MGHMKVTVGVFMHLSCRQVQISDKIDNENHYGKKVQI